jgi:hypothetical protein
LLVGENYHSLPLAVTPNSQPPFSPTPSSSLSPTRQQAGRHLLAAPPMASSALLPLLAELLHSSGSSMAAQLLPHGATPCSFTSRRALCSLLHGATAANHQGALPPSSAQAYSSRFPFSHSAPWSAASTFLPLLSLPSSSSAPPFSMASASRETFFPSAQETPAMSPNSSPCARQLDAIRAPFMASAPPWADLGLGQVSVHVAHGAPGRFGSDSC